MLQQALPGWLRTTGDGLPLTRAADAARRLADGGVIAWARGGAEWAVAVGYALLTAGLPTVFE
ncbi:hypothetical protein [Streptomyces sp. WM6378]|uniref:hypothetical protein n=1 Tax=Streptomyces sp. WM6378 TaxID=1415557 RepID=UPI0006AF367C|nr:hypothetical protein [Streptomyces sp. WM6378]